MKDWNLQRVPWQLPPFLLLRPPFCSHSDNKNPPSLESLLKIPKLRIQPFFSALLRVCPVPHLSIPSVNHLDGEILHLWKQCPIFPWVPPLAENSELLCKNYSGVRPVRLGGRQKWREKVEVSPWSPWLEGKRPSRFTLQWKGPQAQLRLKHRLTAGSWSQALPTLTSVFFTREMFQSRAVRRL